uniref:Peptidyl-prolyl cis-trans isomerase n=1 Tax=Rhizophora mucronata TaxID=61149 RepID=A0A2P2JZE6_RHIMU
MEMASLINRIQKINHMTMWAMANIKWLSVVAQVCLFWKVKMKMAFQFPSHKRVKLGIRSNKMN